MAKLPIVDIGDEVRAPVEFSLDEILTDPTEVTVKVELGDGTEVTFSTPVSAVPTADIVRTVGKPVGSFEYSRIMTIAGETTFRWFGDGAVNAAWERTLTVKSSRFAAPLAKS